MIIKKYADCLLFFKWELQTCIAARFFSERCPIWRSIQARSKKVRKQVQKKQKKKKEGTISFHVWCPMLANLSLYLILLYTDSYHNLVWSNVDIIEATAIQPEAFRDNNYDDGQMNDDLNNNGEIAYWILLSCLTNTCIPVFSMHSKAFLNKIN